MSTSIVLADDHVVVREGIRAILSAEEDFEIVAEAVDGLEALEVVEVSKPDVLVLDLSMPALPGREVIKGVESKSPVTRVVVLSMHADEAYVLQALRSGAMGYVIKNAGADELAKAIREAVAGRRYVSPPLSLGGLQVYDETIGPDFLDPYEALSPREREVFHMAADGYTNKRIATRLEISRRTVEAYRANVMRKLRLRSQSDLIRYAISREGSPAEP